MSVDLFFFFLTLKKIYITTICNLLPFEGWSLILEKKENQKFFLVIVRQFVCKQCLCFSVFRELEPSASICQEQGMHIGASFRGIQDSAGSVLKTGGIVRLRGCLLI